MCLEHIGGQVDPYPPLQETVVQTSNPKQNQQKNLRGQVKESRRKSFMEPRAQADPQARRDLRGDGGSEGRGTKSAK